MNKNEAVVAAIVDFVARQHPNERSTAAQIAAGTGLPEEEVERVLGEQVKRGRLPIGCALCHYAASSKEEVDRHLFEQHPEAVTVTCTICDIEIVGPDAIFDHMHDVHPDLTVLADHSSLN